MLQKTIPSYLYWQYQEDSDLRAFVRAFNTLAQEDVDWFNQINLPIYTGGQISGDLLDWVAEGLYGSPRPVLPSGREISKGPFNTWALNTFPFNGYLREGPTDFFVTTDDVFKRILTWNFYKGDGQVFNVRWLKRRIMRFLTGENGEGQGVNQTYQISVTFGTGNQVNINILPGLRTVTGGAIFNRFGMNEMPFNTILSTYESFLKFELAPILQAAINSGAVQLPFQYEYVVSI